MGVERKESKETNRRGKDLNSIMARNDHGRWKICARGRFVKIKAPFTQRAIRSTSVSTILNVLMEGERNSIQHQEINKSIPFLELIHSLEFSRRIVGKRWSSNPIDLHYTRKETFRFSGGNVTREKRRQTYFFLVPFHPFTYFLIRSSSNKYVSGSFLDFPRRPG